MSRVSINRVAATVARNMGIEYLGPQWGNIIEWAMEAESKIGSFDTYVKKTRLYACYSHARQHMFMFFSIAD